ncbi:Uncharacterised protein [uncultured archaeon]|nr:Uncharacterised protein [uncultured archaeon]
MEKLKTGPHRILQATPENMQRHNHYLLTIIRLERMDPPETNAVEHGVSAELFKRAVAGDYAGSPLTTREAFEFFKSIDEVRFGFGKEQDAAYVANLRREQLRVFLGRVADADAQEREAIFSRSGRNFMIARFHGNLKPEVIGELFDMHLGFSKNK